MNEPETKKVVLIGDSGVGKTSIISRFTTHKFDRGCQMSLNSQFTQKTMEFPKYNKSLQFDIWDTVGQEKYRSLTKIFYKSADVIIFVYDITSENSFNSIKNYWYTETINNTDKNPILVLAANKSDLYKDEKINNSEGKNYANEIKAIFGKISALSNSGINRLFENIGKKIIDPDFNYQDEKLLREINDLKSIKSHNTNKTKISNKTNITNQTNQTKSLEIDNRIKLEGNTKEKKKCC